MDDELLLRYAAGNALPHENAQVQEWAAADARNAQALGALEAAWADVTAGESGAAGDADAAGARQRWQRIAGRLGSDQEHGRHTSRPVGRREWLSRAAAVLLLLAGAALFALSRAGGDAAPQVAWTTAVGETLDVVLPDGSAVRLGPSSALRLDDAFDSAERRVHLRGTAVFNVRRAEPLRFVVLARGVTATVLGTEFVVRAYDDEDAVDVGVVEGRVSVAAEHGDGEELVAGERAQVEAGRIRVQRADVGALLGWRERSLVFRDATLAEVARELERWYDVEVDITDARLEQRRITLSVHAAPLDEVLQLMQATLGVPMTLQGRRVRIGPVP